jgi:cyclic GMP-AMP synthase DncV-like protein/adenylyl/guanylyl cyclase-like protein with sensor domain
LQGSYKSATQIRPVRCTEEFDIDLGVYFQWEGSPQDGRHDAKTLKCFVQDSLQEYAVDNADDVMEVTPPKPRCCRIRYKSSFHIDVPAYHLDAKRDARSLATESGREDSDPKAIYIWFRDRFDDVNRAKVRRQIKYTKTWAALKFREDNGRPSSTLLTVLVAEAAKALGTSISGADDDTLREILEKIVDRLEADREVSNPVKKSENLACLSHAEMTTFIRHLKIFLDVAKRATEKDTELAAADIWQDAFEYLFPMPEVTEVVTEAAKRLPVPLAMPEVKVTAVSRDNPATGRFPDTNRIGPIPKNCDIHFEIGNAHALPSNSTVVWMVRNEGGEAENINDLGHYAGTGLSAKEHSSYKGTHYMDCVVKVGGQTVAMRRVPVTISGIEMPRRNPASRPQWIKLRGRR